MLIIIIINLQIQQGVHMWAFMAVVMALERLVKSEIVKVAVSVTRPAIPGVTAVLMPVPVSSIQFTMNPMAYAHAIHVAS